MILPTKKLIFGTVVTLFFCFSTNVSAYPTVHFNWNAQDSEYSSMTYSSQNESNFSDLHSSSHDNNNSHSATHSYDRDHFTDHLNDLTCDTRRQEISEREAARNENTGIDNQPQSKRQTVRESDLHKKTVVSLKASANLRLDSTRILKEVKTDSDLEKTLSSPIIKARFQRINRTLKKMSLAGSSKHIRKEQYKFLDALISDKATQLVHQKQHPDLNVAQSAFDELKQLWCWKHEHTFQISSLKPNSGEADFITVLGVDIMKIDEKGLITRPDYITKHARVQEQKTIQEFKQQCYLLQQKGDLDALLNENQRLYRCAVENGNKSDLTTNICLAIVEDCLFDPITNVLNIIVHAPSLETARTELMNLEIQILEQARQKNITLSDQVTLWITNHYGFDVLNAAQNSYKSRADYISTAENQSVLSNDILTIVDNIEHKDLPSAHAELVNFENQIDTALEERNITDPIAQKEYIKKSFGKDVLEAAHKKYEARADHKQLVESFMAIDINQVTTTILENNNTYESVANEMSDLAEHVFVNAHHCNLSNLPKIESHVYDSIDAMRTAQDNPTFIFNLSIVNHTLGDIQQIAHAILSGKHPTLERSSELLIRGFGTFFKGLDPLTQASSMGHLASDLGSFFKKSGIALWNDPITVIHNGTTSVFTLTELIRNAADFTSDLTVGKLYLSPEEYKQRTDAFCAIIEPLQGVTAEHCVDFLAQVVADTVFFKGLGNAYNFLKEIDALEKLSESAACVSRAFKKGFDTHLTNNPIMVTAEGITIKMSDDLKEVGEQLKNSSLGQKIILRVANMKEFFELPFGKILRPHSVKTSYHYQKFSIYKLTTNIPDSDLKKGYFYYLDSLHCDHLEVFNKQLKVVGVYNLDGTLNIAKSKAAEKAGRTIKLT